MVCTTTSLEHTTLVLSRCSKAASLLLCSCLLFLACSKSEPATSTSSSTEASLAPSQRATTAEDFVSRSLEFLRQGKLDAWNAVQLSRDEYEARCPLLLQRNSAGWLDKEMASRSNLEKTALSEFRCKRLQSSSTPFEILWQEGGERSTTIHMPECEGFTALEPFRLLVEGGEGVRYSVRLDAFRDDSSGEYIPSGYAECHDAGPFKLACKKAEAFFRGREDSPFFASWECTEQLESEANESALLAARCLEQAKDFETARSCWGERPLERSGP